MEYKVGDDVMVKAKITSVFGATYTADCSCGNFYLKNEDILHEPQMTAEEAWEIAKNLFADYSNIELDEIFGKGWSFPKLMELTPHEAKVKIEECEQKKEIKVGDEVAPKSDPNNNECKFVVTKKDDKEGIINGFSVFDGDVFSGRDINQYQKTGRHIDIKWILNQIGGSDA